MLLDFNECNTYATKLDYNNLFISSVEMKILDRYKGDEDEK